MGTTTFNALWSSKLLQGNLFSQFWRVGSDGLIVVGGFVCERMKSLKFRRESFLVVGTPEETLTQVAVGCVNGQPSGAAH
jgi:hypothetical protein